MPLRWSSSIAIMSGSIYPKVRMPHVELPAGTIDYDDTGGHWPVVVLVHGLLMDGAQWRHVVADLRRDHRCVLPTLPMGAHRRPMQPDADLSLRGLGGS